MKLAYTGYDRAGQTVRDVIEAAGPAEAAEQLRREGLFVTRVEGGPATGSEDSSAPDHAGSPRRLSTGKRLKHLAMFTRQLYVLSSTGTPLAEALSALERQAKNPTWKAVVARLRHRVEEGVSLSEAMSEDPACFDPVFRSLIAAGESSSRFEAMLDRVATLVRKQAHARKTVTGALIYPALLLSVSVVVLTSMLLFVVPRFTGLFDSLGAPLPPTTQALMMVSQALRGYWWGMLIGLGAAGGGVWWWCRTPGGREAIDTALVRCPWVRHLTRSFATGRIIRMLGTLLESGVPLLEALDLTREAAGNLHYRRLIDKAEAAVTRGDPMSQVFADERLISASVHEAVRSGEATGQIGPLLLNMSEFLDEENEVVLRSLTSILEPVILLMLGLVVGIVALSMFLPLFDLTAAA